MFGCTCTYAYAFEENTPSIINTNKELEPNLVCPTVYRTHILPDIQNFQKPQRRCGLGIKRKKFHLVQADAVQNKRDRIKTVQGTPGN